MGSLQGSNFALNIDVKTFDVVLEGNPELKPNSIVYPTKDEIKVKEFTGKTIGFSVVLIPQDNRLQFLIADPLQAQSMFTQLFFLEGHGKKCFQKFDEAQTLGGGKIITWIVDYSCQQKNNVYFQPQEEVRASHILISTQGRSEEEARALAEKLKKEIAPANFAQYAQQYSEDPGSKSQGGDLGWFGKNAMVPEFDQAAFSLKPGQISGLVKTQFGYHLILVTDKRTKS